MPNRITPAQIFALAIIWSAVAYGMTAGDRPQQSAQAKAARSVACR